MFKALSYGLLALTPTVTLGNSCDKYLQVTLWDSFGDGWGDAQLRLTDPSSTTSTVSLDCSDANTKVFNIVPEDFATEEGVYSLTVATPDSTVPANRWEVYWTVEEFDGSTPTGVYYEGTYGTVMNWQYECDGGLGLMDRRKLPHSVSDSWTLTTAENLPDFSCSGCSGDKCDKGKEKSKDKKSKNAPIKNAKAGPSIKDSESSNSTEGVYTYGERNTDLSVKMWADRECKGKKCPEKGKKKSCDGWVDGASPIPSHWYISDTTGTTLFDDGALCDGCAGSCDLCLGDGSYVFRVTGSFQNETDDEFKVWEFCNTRGYFNDQLNFHIKKGKCHPHDLRWSNEVCDEQESTVTINGAIALSGFSSEIFVSKAAAVVLDTLSKTVSGWNVADMSVISTSLDARALADNQRALRTYTHDIEFSVNFIAENFATNGASYSEVESLLNDMAATLEASFAAGSFTSILHGEAVTLGVDALQSVSNAELVYLEINSISYAQSHMVYYYGDDATVSSGNSGAWSDSVSNSTILMFMTISAFGFIAFVGIAKHGFKSYATLSTVSDSEVSMNRVVEAGVRSPFGTFGQKYQPVASPSLKI